MKKNISTVLIVVASAAFALGCSGKKGQQADVKAEEGIRFVAEGRLDEGMRSFEEALKLNPDHPRAHCGIGTIYRKQEKYEEAIAKYEHAIGLDPDYVVCIDNLGLAYAMTEDFENAEKQFLKASSLDETYADSHHNLGALYERLGRTGKAVEEYEKYISRSDDGEMIEKTRKQIEELRQGGK
ncbi:MAG: tetratricopeptide repeat protein [bacterium]